MSAECGCSEEYGLCEDHSVVLARRGGAALRTADELLAVFIGDVEAIVGRPITDHDASAVAAEYWTATDNAGGWLDHERFPDLAEALHDAATYGAEGALPSDVYVWWDDGYVISRITGGPLADEPVVKCGMCWRADVVYRETGGVDDNGEAWTAPCDPTTGEPHYCAGMSDR